MKEDNDIQDYTREFIENREAVDRYIDRLEYMSRFDSVDALDRVKGRIRKINRYKQIYNGWQKIAAVLIFPIMALSLLQFIKSSEGEVAWNETSAMYGMLSKITLPDSSTVELNSCSKLRYPSRFDSDRRVVELEGEGFFKVKSDKEHPFLVKCNGVSVQAVGTSFNVLTRKNGEIVMSLKEGKVKILKDTEEGRRNLATLAPGQTVVYDTHTSEIKEIITSDIDKYLAWRDGKLIFRRDKLPEIFEELERRYNVIFDVSRSADMSGVFTGTFVNKDLETILEYISMTTSLKFDALPEMMNESRIIKVE